MEEKNPQAFAPSPEEQVRALGFDPNYLTPHEWEELLELQQLCPDEAVNA